MLSLCFSLPQIHCPSCTSRIENALASWDVLDIQQFAIDISSKQLTLKINDLRKEQEVRDLVRAKLQEIKFEAIDIMLLSKQEPSQDMTRKKRWWDVHWFRGSFGVVLGLGLMVCSFAIGTLPLLAMFGIAIVTVPAILFLGWHSYREAFKEMRQRNLTMDSLFALSTLIIIGVSLAALFVPWLPMMLDAGLLIFGVRHIGQAIEASIKRKVNSTQRFTDLLPKIVRFKNKMGVEKKKFLNSVDVGDILLIHPGEIIPVDGICQSTRSFIIETIITGSKAARKLQENDLLLSGMMLAPNSPPIALKVSHKVQDSYLTKIDEKIALANHQKGVLETIATRILQYFIPTIILLAFLSATVISIFFPVAMAIQCAIAVLVSACPCTLGLITPLAVKIGMNKAAEQGILFQSAKTLQDAERIDCVVFDLNGTLTEGKPKVLNCWLLDETPQDLQEIFQRLACLERDATHPVGEAIRHYVHEQHIVCPAAWQDTLVVDEHQGGLQAMIDGEICLVGNETFMLKHGISIEASVRTHRAGDGIVYFARSGQVKACISLINALRVHAKEALAELQRMGKSVYICTGADEATAAYYAASLNVPKEHVRAACVGSATSVQSQDKASFIKALKQKGHRVAMVGDAENDALALAASDFGVAIAWQGGHSLTEQQAGAVVNTASLKPIVGGFTIARQTVRHIKQNLLFSFFYNMTAVSLAGGLLLALGFILHPGIGVALMALQTALILYNAYRFKEQEVESIERMPDVKEVLASSYQKLVRIFKPEKKSSLVYEYDKRAYNSLFEANAPEVSSQRASALHL